MLLWAPSAHTWDPPGLPHRPQATGYSPVPDIRYGIHTNIVQVLLINPIRLRYRICLTLFKEAFLGQLMWE